MEYPAPAPLPPNATPQEVAARKKMADDEAAFLITAAAATVVGFVALLAFGSYIVGGVKLVAQVACMAGLIAIGLVYAYRYIRARV